MPERKRIIYDFGANNGDDIPYYLQKSDMVIAVEANPELVSGMRSRFSEQIESKRLVVENSVLTVEKERQEVPFYIHKSGHVLSQLPRPDPSMLCEYDEVLLRSLNVMDIINHYGNPFYIKIDLEHYDHILLKELLLNNIRPQFISVEAHDIEVFSLLVALGNYKSFSIVDGPTVESKYKNCPIKTDAGEELYSFPGHSAGPFGEDIQESWMTPCDFFRLLAFEQLGWKDIHATNEIAPEAGARSYLLKALKVEAKGAIRARTPSLFNILKKLRRSL